jgi:hypothetical protein
LPPYFPDYNPIEQSFAELKVWMRGSRALADSYRDDFGFVALAVQYMAQKAGKHFVPCLISLENTD